MTACRKALGHDQNIIKKCTSGWLDCLTMCYGGDHTACHKFSFVCKMGRQYRFPFMPRVAKGCLSISDADRVKIRSTLEVRVCSQRLWSTRLQTSTQKAESVNNAFNVTNPKHSATFSRNGKYRDHSAIHLTNNGPGESIVRKMDAVGIQLTANSPCVKALRQMQRKREYNKFRKSCQLYRSRRAKLRFRKYRLHEKTKNISFHTSEYKKDQLISTCHDHSYSRQTTLDPNYWC